MTSPSSAPPTAVSAPTGLAQAQDMPVSPHVSRAPVSSEAQPVSARRRHRPCSTTDTTSPSAASASRSQPGKDFPSTPVVSDQEC
ncbi:hypothetical protein ACE6H2_022768 [Prunus campanulata]